jgi:preprotein translocase subunit SecB
MKAHKSPLILNNFFLLNLNYNFIEPSSKKEIDISKIVSEYELEIDYVIPESVDDSFQLYTKISVNSVEKPSPGYVLFIEGVCVFTFNKSVKLTEDDISNLLHFSGLSICINSLRNILGTATAHGPFGKYTLPSIDVKKLLSDKHQLK